MNKPSFTWRPTTTIILLWGLAALLIYSVVVYAFTHFQPTTEVRLGSGVYHLRIADTDAKRTQGLSGVDKLKPDDGLLMKYETDGKWGIWMKDMLIPLDIIWLNKDKVVVYIVKNAKPELSTGTTFSPKADARYVLELPAGSVEKAGVRMGQQAAFNENDKGGLW